MDPGERRVGVALSDPGGIIAQPWAVIDRSVCDVVAEVGRIVRENEVDTIVVGLPITLAGQEGAPALAARELATDLQEATGVMVELHDERYTTVAAEQVMRQGRASARKRRDRRDKVAAAIILSEYLMGRPAAGTAGGER